MPACSDNILECIVEDFPSFSAWQLQGSIREIHDLRHLNVQGAFAQECILQGKLERINKNGVPFLLWKIKRRILPGGERGKFCFLSDPWDAGPGPGSPVSPAAWCPQRAPVGPSGPRTATSSLVSSVNSLSRTQQGRRSPVVLPLDGIPFSTGGSQQRSGEH